MTGNIHMEAYDETCRSVEILRSRPATDIGLLELAKSQALLLSAFCAQLGSLREYVLREPATRRAIRARLRQLETEANHMAEVAAGRFWEPIGTPLWAFEVANDP